MYVKKILQATNKFYSRKHLIWIGIQTSLLYSESSLLIKLFYLIFSDGYAEEAIAFTEIEKLLENDGKKSNLLKRLV